MAWERETIDFWKATEEAKRSGFFREAREDIKWAISDALTQQSDWKLDADIIVPSKMNIEEMTRRDGSKKNHINDK